MHSSRKVCQELGFILGRKNTATVHLRQTYTSCSQDLVRMSLLSLSLLSLASQAPPLTTSPAPRAGCKLLPKSQFSRYLVPSSSPPFCPLRGHPKCGTPRALSYCPYTYSSNWSSSPWILGGPGLQVLLFPWVTASIHFFGLLPICPFRTGLKSPPSGNRV